MPTIEGLDHIAIATADLDGALRFWEAQLGLRCEHVEELPERGIKVAFLPVGNTRIELVSPLPGREDDSEVSAFLKKRGGGIHHLALRTPDVDAAAAEVASAGAALAQGPSPGAHGCRVAFIHPKSTGGVLLELSTPPSPTSQQ
jgi:methylmalonyl-CoA epimerase